MSKYPKIQDKNFSNKINKIFNKFKIEKKKKSMKDICYPTSFTHSKPQNFVSKYINPETPYTDLLVYHGIGSGKTCAAINIAEQWKKKRKILVVLPASLKGNFRTELRSLCAGNSYLTNKERNILKKSYPTQVEYKEIIKESDKRIDKIYDIMSYNKFIDLCQNKKINLENKLLIIDEVQNLISEKGSYYKILSKTIEKAPKNLRLVLLSATPIFDKPIEIGLTLNLLRLPNKIPIKEFNTIFMEKYIKNKMTQYRATNIDELKKNIKGFISYYKGAPNHTYPDKEIKYVKCKMENFQYKSYQTVLSKEIKNKKIFGDILKLPNNFFIGSRIISNIAFPNKKINEKGFESFKGAKLNSQNLKKYSIKFYKILQKIKSCKGTIFIYSNFKEYGGIKSLVQVLEHYNYRNYKDYGEGTKRFAIWSGDEICTLKEEIKTIFNQKENKDGSKIKILLGSPSIKEGVSLLRVQQVHILEPYWNLSRLDQIIGRAIRYCSHKDVKKEERKVKVYIYISSHEKEKESIDEYIQKLAFSKSSLIKEFENALKEVAVDCYLNKNGNDKSIKCQ
jgi:superfamily II DNA or RNA helicase